MSELVHLSISDDVAHLALDDGKANAISHAMIEAIHGALDTAVAEARAVVLSGRPGRFSAGFDLSVVSAGIEAAQALVREGALLTMRIYEVERPVLIAATGHALAQGAIFLMAADVRIGATGPFKIGLNEVAIGMPLPVYAAELARDRLSRRHVTAATALATIFDPAGAVDAGYLDAVVDPDEVVPTTLERARALASTLNLRAFAATRRTMRGEVAEKVRTTLQQDIGAFFVDA